MTDADTAQTHSGLGSPPGIATCDSSGDIKPELVRRFLDLQKELRKEQEELINAARQVHAQLSCLSSAAVPADAAEDLMSKVSGQAPSPGLARYLESRSTQVPDAAALSAAVHQLSTSDKARGLVEQMSQLTAEAREAIERLCSADAATTAASDLPDFGRGGAEEPFDISTGGVPSEPEGRRPDWDIAMLMATVMDMTALDHSMQETAWRDVGPSMELESLGTYLRLCSLRPFFAEEILERLSALISKVPSGTEDPKQGNGVGADAVA